ncbi:MAG TPA: phosphoribosylformylglycinamidine synthase subunit PurQ [Bdellovibrionota bacterium]|nr:phosphoribosylformylglycinamidine synthase subunit PurQ [Bdellovibrionota bacterium]
MAKIAVVIFPGSNCDRDAFYVVKDILGKSVTYHWHDEPIRDEYKAVILPGGFSYGDYLRAGALAKISPAVSSLGPFIDRGGWVLGICNGFQTLVEAGYLPGALMKNRSLQFQCEDVHVRIESTKAPFFDDGMKGKVLRLPIAHSEGRYDADDATLGSLRTRNQIALRYVGPKGEEEDRFNANGSAAAIAGITNERGNVFGLMPHPERCSDEALGNTDGLTLLRKLGSIV